MKVSKNLPGLKEILEAGQLLDKSVLVSKCGMEDERVAFDWYSAENEKISYFSTIIVKKSGVK